MLTIQPMLIVPDKLLLDGDDPYKVLDRLMFLSLLPEASFEKSGQYKDGTVFIEGLCISQKEIIPLLRLCGFSGSSRRM